MIDDAGQTHRHDIPRILVPWIIHEPDHTSRAIRRQQILTGVDQTMGAVMGVVLAAYIILTRNLGLPGYLFFAGALLLGCTGGWLMWWGAFRRLESHWESLGQQWTDAGLSRCRCPLCLYSLAGAEPDAQGAAQCAECGAIWRHSRIRASDHELSRWRRFLSVMLNADARRKLHDDDGRTFAAERLSAIAARASSAADPETAAIAREIRSASNPARVLAGAAVGAFFLLPFIPLLWILTRATVPLPAWVPLMAPIMLLPPAIMLGAIACSDLGLGATTRRRKMLAAGLCPVCASAGLIAAEDDPADRACSGCGAVWREGAGASEAR